MTRYEDKKLDETWEAGRDSDEMPSGPLPSFSTRLIKASRAGKRNSASSVPTTPRQSEAVPTAPSTAVSRARTAMAENSQLSTRPVTALSIGADLQEWKPVVADRLARQSVAVANGARAQEPASSEPLPRRVLPIKPMPRSMGPRQGSAPSLATPPRLRTAAPEPATQENDEAAPQAQSFISRPRVPRPPPYLSRSQAMSMRSSHDDANHDNAAQSFRSHAQRRAASHDEAAPSFPSHAQRRMRSERRSLSMEDPIHGSLEIAPAAVV